RGVAGHVDPFPVGHGACVPAAHPRRRRLNLTAAEKAAHVERRIEFVGEHAHLRVEAARESGIEQVSDTDERGNGQQLGHGRLLVWLPTLPVCTMSFEARVAVRGAIQTQFLESTRRSRREVAAKARQTRGGFAANVTSWTAPLVLL